MKHEKRISTTVEEFAGEWPPEDGTGFIAWFQKRLDDVPLEFRASVCIELNTTSRYDTGYVTIEFSYTRLETGKEEAEREQQEAALAEQRRAKELRLLAELQAKYGHPS